MDPKIKLIPAVFQSAVIIFDDNSVGLFNGPVVMSAGDTKKVIAVKFTTPSYLPNDYLLQDGSRVVNN